MALLNIAAMTDGKEVDSVAFEIDDRTANSLIGTFKRCDGLMGHEAMGTVRRALEEISDVKVLSAEAAAALAGSAAALAGSAVDAPQPTEQGPQGAEPQPAPAPAVNVWATDDKGDEPEPPVNTPRKSTSRRS